MSFGAVRRIERRVDFGEIPDVRTMDDGGAEPDRLRSDFGRRGSRASRP